jgi:putative FmdB family regulatory protein
MQYEYECPGDGQVITIERGMTEEEQEYDCPVCGTTLQRIYSAPAIKFMGTGWGGNHAQG